MPVYLITNRTDSTQRLVRAANKAAAIRYVAADTLGAAVAAQETLIDLLQAGVRVEDAGEQAAEPSGDACAISDAMRMTDDGEIREVRAPASRSDGGIRYDAMMEHGLSIFSEGSPAARTDGDIHDGSEA